MNSPYKQRLEGYLNTDDVVVVNRSGATDLTGIVEEVDDGGCKIKMPGTNTERKFSVFVAFEDIRGVGFESWDLSHT